MSKLLKCVNIVIIGQVIYWLVVKKKFNLSQIFAVDNSGHPNRQAAAEPPPLPSQLCPPAVSAALPAEPGRGVAAAASTAPRSRCCGPLSRANSPHRLASRKGDLEATGRSSPG